MLPPSAAGQRETRGKNTGLLFESQDICFSNNIGVGWRGMLAPCVIE
jgi:hypothetical protein